MPAAYRNRRKNFTEGLLYQLAKIFGEPAGKPEAFFYRDWARERYTATSYDQPPMLEHPLYCPPAGRSAIWEDTVLSAGSETADLHGGYLEGALASAERAAMSLEPPSRAGFLENPNIPE